MSGSLMLRDKRVLPRQDSCPDEGVFLDTTITDETLDKKTGSERKEANKK